MRNPRTDFFRSYALETTLFPHPSLCGIIILEITNGFDFLLIAGPPICSPVGCLDLSLFGVSDRANWKWCGRQHTHRSWRCGILAYLVIWWASRELFELDFPLCGGGDGLWSRWISSYPAYTHTWQRGEDVRSAPRQNPRTKDLEDNLKGLWTRACLFKISITCNSNTIPHGQVKLGRIHAQPVVNSLDYLPQ